MEALTKYEPIAMVTFKDGSAPVFIPAANSDAVGKAVNTSGVPLVHIGNRWVDRFSVKEIIDLADYDSSTAKGWLALCPQKYRARLALSIEKNEEAKGSSLSSQWAQSTVAAWAKADEVPEKKDFTIPGK
jgi:hypothetical protein